MKYLILIAISLASVSKGADSILVAIAKTLQDHEKRIAKLEKSIGFPSSAYLYYSDCVQTTTGNWRAPKIRVVSEHGDTKDKWIDIESAKQGDCETQVKTLRDKTSVLRAKVGEIVFCTNLSNTRTILAKYVVSSKPDVIDTGNNKEFSSDADCLAGMKTYYDNLKW